MYQIYKERVVLLVCPMSISRTAGRWSLFESYLSKLTHLKTDYVESHPFHNINLIRKKKGWDGIVSYGALHGLHSYSWPIWHIGQSEVNLNISKFWWLRFRHTRNRKNEGRPVFPPRSGHFSSFCFFVLSFFYTLALYEEKETKSYVFMWVDERSSEDDCVFYVTREDM